MSSVALYVPKTTFLCGFDSFRAHHISNRLARFALCLRSVYSQSHHSAVRFRHLIRCRITVHIHGRSNVHVSHELLLYAHWRSDRIQPGAIGMPQRVRPKFYLLPLLRQPSGTCARPDRTTTAAAQLYSGRQRSNLRVAKTGSFISIV